jgi:flagellin
MAISAIGAGSSLSALDRAAQALQSAFAHESTGKRVQSAADESARYAIANALHAQVAAYEQASSNVQTALNSAYVATAALSTTSSLLSQLRNLAVAAVDDFLAPADRAALQAQADQLVKQANTVAQTTTFNGAPLLNGTYAGPNAGSPAMATIPANVPLAEGGNLVTQITAANANFQNPNGTAQGFGGNATTDSTIQIHIVAGNSGNAVAQVTAVDNATGQQITQATLYAPGATVTGIENVNIKLGNFTNADIGQTATIQIQQAVPANTHNSALQVQSGANEGNTTPISYGNATASSLRIANLNLSSSAGATNAIGQIDNAIQQLGTIQTAVGAQQVALGYQTDADNVAALNLQAAQSNLVDANVGHEATRSTLSQIQQELSLAVLAQRNTQAAGVLTLFGH